MNLTSDKLANLWQIRQQIFDDPSNQEIITRFNKITDLFKYIQDINMGFDTDGNCVINNEKVKFKDGQLPSTTYFACKDDDVTAAGAFIGVENMKKKFPDSYSELIHNIGCLLGGFTFSETPIMKDEFRILSNTITKPNDNGSLNSNGESRHPSSHLADNNYFFNVIQTIQDIKQGTFDPKQSKLVLRWPQTDSYYVGLEDEEIKEKQINTLTYRFPYKFFYMWTQPEVIHPIGLLSYKTLVTQPNDIGYKGDTGMNQSYDDFIDNEQGWKSYSQKIANLIQEQQKDENFYQELSKLIAIITLKDQPIRNMRELVQIGNKAIILYGPPGTGKTYQAQALVCQLLGITEKELDKHKFGKQTDDNINGKWTIVQFHPNYTYEDFIGGISPSIKSGTLSYILKDGIFKQLCDAANNNKEEKFVIIIDEINRADLSSVFGELMYALEYRDQEISIPNFAEPFVIPSNVYLIGTMNSIDKSLVTFDLALRRRFGFIKVMPNPEILRDILSDNINTDNLNKFIDRCTTLNNEISKELGSDYQIGHAYYAKIKDFLHQPQNTQGEQNISESTLQKLWGYHLQPLIEEYYGNRIDEEQTKQWIKEQKNNFTASL